MAVVTELNETTDLLSLRVCEAVIVELAKTMDRLSASVYIRCV